MQYKSSDDILVWPDNTQCYMHELHEMQHMSDDYIVIPVGSIFYPDGITIQEVDYDAVVSWRRLMTKVIKGE